MLAATVVVNVAPVVAQVTHRPLHATAAVTGAPVAVPFGIEYFGLSAVLPAGTPPPSDHVGEVRFHRQGAWESWHPLGEDGAQGQDQFTAALVAVDHADSYQVRGLPATFGGAHATALNLTDGPVTSNSVTLGQPAAAAGNTCASRADWNADESITGWSTGKDTMAFAPDQVVTVHHTAGSNDPSQNYAQTVLAIEQYHVLTNGWSDIGYQYLIDPNGVVYEGRSSGHTSRSCVAGGGDGSDFAHRTSDDTIVTGAHTGGYNTGNLGIAMIGCFDSTNTTCSPTKYGANDTSPTTAATAALEQLLAKLANRHGLNPNGTVNYANATNTKPGVPTFTGHRDWEATACPGGNLYAQLPSLRTNVATDLAPTGLQASTTATSAHLSWSPGAAWPGAPRATKYRVRRGGAPLADTAALTFDDANLTPGTTYSYDVTALAADGTTSSPSTTVTASTAAAGGATPDFTMAVTPNADTAAAGTSRTPTITTTASGGASTVTLTAGVQPAGNGITVSVGASSINAGSTDSLTVSTTAGTPAGTYTVTVTGTSPSASHTATYTLTVTNAAPTASITPSGCSGSTCTFAGSSQDPEGGPTTLGWAMPSGTPNTAGNVTATSTTYSGPGTYTVTLTATDRAALSKTATAHVSCTTSGKGKTRTLNCTATTP